MSEAKQKTIFGMNPMKVLFAMEYVLQGLANPFRGSWAGAALQFVGLFWAWGLDLISSLIITFLRKAFLDWKYKPQSAL